MPTAFQERQGEEHIQTKMCHTGSPPPHTQDQNTCKYVHLLNLHVTDTGYNIWPGGPTLKSLYRGKRVWM